MKFENFWENGPFLRILCFDRAPTILEKSWAFLGSFLCKYFSQMGIFLQKRCKLRILRFFDFLIAFDASQTIIWFFHLEVLSWVFEVCRAGGEHKSLSLSLSLSLCPPLSFPPFLHLSLSICVDPFWTLHSLSFSPCPSLSLSLLRSLPLLSICVDPSTWLSLEHGPLEVSICLASLNLMVVFQSFF